MTLTIDFTPAEERQLVDAARQEGLDLAGLVKTLVRRQLPQSVSDAEDPMLALFSRWDQEDEQMMPPEVAEENRSWEDFKANINAERERIGARHVF